VLRPTREELKICIFRCRPHKKISL